MLGLGIKEWIVIGLGIVLLGALGTAAWERQQIEVLNARVALVTQQRDIAIDANKGFVLATKQQNAGIDAWVATADEYNALYQKALTDLAVSKKTAAGQSAQKFAEQFKPIAGKTVCENMDSLIGDWWLKYRSVQ